MNIILRWGCLLCVGLLSACAPMPHTEMPAASAAIELREVPFFPQEQYQCGPAALATLLQWSGISITPDVLAPDLMIPARKGSLQIELLAQARARDRVPYPLQGDLNTLYAELSAGHPVLVLQNLGLDWSPVWHYAVVVGMDPEQGTITLRSGRTARHVVEQTTFERTWARSKFWGLLVLPPDQLPATAEPDKVLQVAISLERLERWASVGAWYQAALRRWPEQTVFALGIANSHYARGDLAAAEQSYRDIIKTFPNDPAAYNNLAWMLGEQERWEEASALVATGLSLPGALQAELRDTERFIRCRGKTDCE